MVKASLYVSRESTCSPGRASSRRTSSALAPLTTKKTSPAAIDISAMRLWSAAASHP
jgi:hypothetical protein